MAHACVSQSTATLCPTIQFCVDIARVIIGCPKHKGLGWWRVVAFDSWRRDGDFVTDAVVSSESVVDGLLFCETDALWICRHWDDWALGGVVVVEI